MVVFSGIDPTDIVQGKLANCYFLSAVAGLAENAERIKDNFKVRKVNAAGCYCIEMKVDGESIDVVVDDWFPFYID